MKKIRDDIWLCVDCTLVAVNGDDSGISTEQRTREVNHAIAQLGPNLVPDFDSETGEGHKEFSHRGCDCCRSGLAGEFHRFAILGWETDSADDEDYFDGGRRSDAEGRL